MGAIITPEDLNGIPDMFADWAMYVDAEDLDAVQLDECYRMLESLTAKLGEARIAIESKMLARAKDGLVQVPGRSYKSVPKTTTEVNQTLVSKHFADKAAEFIKDDPESAPWRIYGIAHDLWVSPKTKPKTGGLHKLGLFANQVLTERETGDKLEIFTE